MYRGNKKSLFAQHAAVPATMEPTPVVPPLVIPETPPSSVVIMTPPLHPRKRSRERCDTAPLPLPLFDTSQHVLARFDARLVSGGGRCLVVLVGPPGAGKTTLANKHCRGYAHINQDTLGTYERCMALAKDAARKGVSMVVDNTNPSRSRRVEYLKVVEGMGYVTVCVVVDTPLGVCKERNAGRKGTNQMVVPEAAYAKFSHVYEAVSMGEGWDEILVMRQIILKGIRIEKNMMAAAINNPNRFGVDVVPRTPAAQIADILRMGLLGSAIRDDVTLEHTSIESEHFMYKMNEWFEMDSVDRKVTSVPFKPRSRPPSPISEALQRRGSATGTPPQAVLTPPLNAIEAVIDGVSSTVTGAVDTLSNIGWGTIDIITGLPETIMEYIMPTGPERSRYVSYSPVVFAILRRHLGITALRLQSEARTGTWKTTGSPGKSASLFFFFGSFVLKSITKEEWTHFRSTLFSSYVKYTCSGAPGGTLLPHFYLVVRIKNMTTNVRYRFALMNNVFRTPHLVPLLYDLKGSCAGRDGVISANGEPPKRTANGVIIRKDNDVGGKLMKVGHTKRSVFLSTLRADTSFLSSVGVIDYSLIVGVRTRLGSRNAVVVVPTRPIDIRSLWAVDGGMASSPFDDEVENSDTYAEEIYYIGIVDVIQPYNSRKKLETFTKGMVYERNAMSVIPPDEYAARMCAMAERIS